MYSATFSRDFLAAILLPEIKKKNGGDAFQLADKVFFGELNAVFMEIFPIQYGPWSRDYKKKNP